MAPHLEITSSRLRLMTLTRDELQILLDSPSLLQMELGVTFSEGLMDERVQHAIRRKLAMMADVQPVDQPWVTYWLIINNETREGIGLAGFKGIPDGKGVTEIGYGMAPNQRGNGMMTEAVSVLTDWGFQSGRCLAVNATTDCSNRASQRVLEKNGFTVKSETDDQIEWLLVKEVI